ncbi:hypothetical protein Aperf_G00000120301 [Anoplocephala perfoliata]
MSVFEVIDLISSSKAESFEKNYENVNQKSGTSSNGRSYDEATASDELKTLFDISEQDDYMSFDSVFTRERIESLKFAGADEDKVPENLELTTTVTMFNEIVCASQLSKIRNNRNFSKLIRIHLIMGPFPKYLEIIYENYLSKFKTAKKRFRFEDFPPTQTWVIMETELYGKSLHRSPPTCPMAVSSVFAQIVLALAAAEIKFAFEHRDLHLGNILLKYNRKANVCSQKVPHTFLNGRTLQPRPGPTVKIVDFTLSRINYRGVPVYTDISMMRDLFNGNKALHAPLYFEMRKLLKGDWSGYKPRNNAKWLHFIGRNLSEIVDKGEFCEVHKQQDPQTTKDCFRALVSKTVSAKSATDYVMKICHSRLLFENQE